MRASRNGVLFDRPRVKPLWKPHKVYHEPIFGRLQSSNADVKHEIDVMRAHYQNDSVLFVGGDGLALMRMNHFLAANPDVYFDQTPFVIPVQGMALGSKSTRRAHPHTYFIWLCVYAGEHPHGPHVSHFVSEAHICHFLANWALLECVQEHMHVVAYGPASSSFSRATHQIDATPDVTTLVSTFKEVIGTTRAQVIKPSTVSHVITGLRRVGVPWRETAALMRRSGADAPDAYIRRHVSALSPYFEWHA